MKLIVFLLFADLFRSVNTMIYNSGFFGQNSLLFFNSISWLFYLQFAHFDDGGDA